MLSYLRYVRSQAINRVEQSIACVSHARAASPDGALTSAASRRSHLLICAPVALRVRLVQLGFKDVYRTMSTTSTLWLKMRYIFHRHATRVCFILSTDNLSRQLCELYTTPSRSLATRSS